MTLPSAPNVLVDVYRGLNVNSPFPPDGTRAALYQVPGVLKHHMKNGRFGFQATNLHWTHLLIVDIATDIRDAYNSLLNGETVAGADTVLIPNCMSVAGCCAFTVVLAQQRKKPSPHLRVYLDRWQPRFTPCTQPLIPGGVGCGACTNQQFPATVYATLQSSDCPCMAGQKIPMRWNASFGLNGAWQWGDLVGDSLCTWTQTVAGTPVFYCACEPPSFHFGQQGRGGATDAYATPGSGGATCSPLNLPFGAMLWEGGPSGSGNLFGSACPAFSSDFTATVGLS